MDNEVLKAIRERRSLRRFKGEQVGDDTLKAVLEAGTWAPTAFGKQDPWIVAVQNEALRARLMAMNARVMGTESDPYYGAPTVVLVFASADSPNKDRDGSLVLGSMMVAAHSVGLASCWINRVNSSCPRDSLAWVRSPWAIPTQNRRLPSRARRTTIAS